VNTEKPPMTNRQEILRSARDKAATLLATAQRNSADMQNLPEFAAVVDAARRTLDNLDRSLRSE
jgi:hypothetical protein